MAAVEPWDPHLEAIVALLNGTTGGQRSGGARFRAESGWTIEFRADRRSITSLITRDTAGRPAHLTDYQLVVAYGLGYGPVPKRPEGTAFAKTLTIREGFRWDEQSLREVVLEALGLVLHVFCAGDATAAEVEDHTKPAGALRLRRR